MNILETVSWVKENHMTIVDWLISIAAFIVPLIISRSGKYKIADRKNLFKGYIIFIIKAVFYQLALLWIFWGAGSILHIPQDIKWLNKKTYLLGCVVASGVCGLLAGISWASRLNLLKRSGKLSKLCTIILVILPILLQGVAYFVAVAKSVSARHWVVIWVPLNFLVILAAIFIISDHDFFEYQDIVVSLEDGEKYEIEPETLHVKGHWIAIDSSVDDITTKFQEERIQKIEYGQEGRKESKEAMKFRNKLLYGSVCLCYLLIAGVVSQLLFRMAVKPIFVAEQEVCLEQDSHYQINAVALDPDAGKLHYDISDSTVISVSENGLISVNGELSGEESITAHITIADEAGNTATMRVEVKK